MTRSRRRTFALLIAALIGALVTVFVVAAGIGAASLSPGETLAAALSLVAPGSVSADSYPAWAPELLRDLRLPRMLMALLVGVALATAGATFQGIFRNPLAEPYLLGVSSGAGLGATIAIVLRPPSALGFYFVPVLAFVGALAAAFLVYRLATFGPDTSSASLLLSGVAVGSTLTAVMSLLMVSTQYDLRTVFSWLLGGLSTASWPKLAVASPVVAAGLLYLLARREQLNVLLLGEERAEQLGVDAAAVRRNLLICGSLMTAAVVAFSGLIGFVGIMAPHIVRLLVGPDYRRVLPACGLFGALLVLCADTVARTAAVPAEIPVGVITAFVGGPFFLYLLRVRRGI